MEMKAFAQLLRTRVSTEPYAINIDGLHIYMAKKLHIAVLIVPRLSALYGESFLLHMLGFWVKVSDTI